MLSVTPSPVKVPPSVASGSLFSNAERSIEPPSEQTLVMSSKLPALAVSSSTILTVNSTESAQLPVPTV